MKKIMLVKSSSVTIVTLMCLRLPSGCFVEVFIDVLDECIYFILICFSAVNSWDPNCTKSNLDLFYSRGLMMAPRS